MEVQSILAEKTVAVSELRKKPCAYFLDEPVAVLSNNKTAGYMVNAELYERMVRLIENQAGISQFRPSSIRLSSIAELGRERLITASVDESGEYAE